MRARLLLFTFLIPLCVQAQVPQIFSYQGVLANVDGTALPDGAHTLVVTLYDSESGGDALWEEMHDVTTISGVFSVVLGSAATIDLVFDRPYYLGVSVDGAAEQSPRIPLTASPYSLGTRTTVAEPEAGQSFAVRGETGDAAHLLSIDGNVEHSGVGTFGGGIVVFSPDTSFDGSGKKADEIPPIGVVARGIEIGVSGISASGIGVRGRSIGRTGVEGDSDEATGVRGLSTNGNGVHGISDNGTGVLGTSPLLGVEGVAAAGGGTGVLGMGEIGVHGKQTFIASGIGVLGESEEGIGVKGMGGTGTGVRGEGAIGVAGSGSGVGGTGVSGASDGASGRGVIGLAFGDGGIGGDFTGRTGLRAQPLEPGLLAADLLGMLRIEDVEPDPTEERVLVWSDDEIVRFKTLSGGIGGVPWFLEDDVIVTDNDLDLKDGMVTVTDDEVTFDNARFTVKNFQAEDVFIYDPNAREGNVNLDLRGTMQIWSPTPVDPALGLQNETGIGIEVKGDVGVSGSGVSTGLRGFSEVGTAVEGLTGHGIGVFGKSPLGGDAVRGDITDHGTWGALGFTSFPPSAGVRGHGGGTSIGGAFTSEEGLAGRFIGDVAMLDRGNAGPSVLTIETVVEAGDEDKFLVWDDDGSTGPQGVVRYATIPGVASCIKCDEDGVTIEGVLRLTPPGSSEPTITIDPSNTEKSVQIKNTSSEMGLGINVNGTGVSSVSFGANGTGGQFVATGASGVGLRAVHSDTDGAAFEALGVSTFLGDVLVAGDVSVTGSIFESGSGNVIDHPLDPSNRVLRHAAIASPDMMNVYNGNVVLDANGEAWVELPEYFEALNTDFRYQLTCIGGFAQVFIAEKIAGNRFRIAGGSPGLEVSWQITGIRDDAYARENRMIVEMEKPIEQRGEYIYQKPNSR